MTVLLSLAGCSTMVRLVSGEASPVNEPCLDDWSAVHFTSGFLLGRHTGENGLLPTLAVLVGWEIAEPFFWPGESSLNVRCDLGVGVAGWLAGIGGG